MKSDPSSYHSKLQRILAGRGLDSDSEEASQDTKEEDLGESVESDSWVSKGSSEDSDSIDPEEAFAYEQKSIACAKVFEDDQGESMAGGDFEGFERLV